MVGFLRRLFGGDTGTDDRTSTDPGVDGSSVVDGNAHLHSVVAWIRLVDPTFQNEREQRRVFAQEDAVMRALYEAHVGDLDTNELDRGFFAIRCAGPDADRMVGVMTPLLTDAPVGSYLAVRRGPVGTGEDRVDLPIAEASPAP
jgi:hypothetical protein